MCDGGMIAAALPSVVSIGGSLLSGNAQRDAAKDANQVALNLGNQQLALFERMYNETVGRSEPFRQSELRRQGVLDYIVGIGPRPGSEPASSSAPQTDPRQAVASNYFARNPDVAAAYGGLSGRDRSYIAGQGFDRDGNGQIDEREYADFHYSTHGRGEGREGYAMPNAFALPPDQLAQITGGKPIQTPIQDTTISGGAGPGGMQVLTPDNMQARSAGAIPGAAAPGAGTPTIDPGVRGAEYFNNSLFDAAYNDNLRYDMDRIDSGLANSGLVFSNARMNAKADAQARNFNNSLNAFLGTLGAPVQSQNTQAINSAGNAFASGSANAFGGMANAGMTSAFARGDASAGMFDNLAGAINYGIGRYGGGK